MFVGLQTRLIASLMGLFCFTLVIMGYVLLGDAKQRNDEFHTAEARMLVKLLADGSTVALARNDRELLTQWVDTVVAGNQFAYAAVIDPAGKVLAHNDHALIGKHNVSRLASVASPNNIAGEQRQVSELSLPIQVGNVHVADAYVGHFHDVIYGVPDRTVARIISAVLLSLIVISLGSLYFTRKIINPIKYFTGFVSNVSYDRHIALEKHLMLRNDEVGVLARTFSDMSGRLFDTYQKIHEKNVELEHRVEERTHKVVTANRDLKAAQQRIHAILDNIADGVITTDESDVIVSCNCAAEQIFEYPQEQLVGRTFHSLFDPNENYSDKLTSGAGAREFIAVRRNGERFSLEMAVSTIYIARACTHIFVLRDISQRKSLIDDLAHMADHDTDTGLYNKHHFEQEIDHVVERVRRGAIEQCAIIYFDFYNFAEIELKFGKAVFGKVLNNVATLLQHRTRKSDELCHLDGNEFVLLAYGASAQQAELVAKNFMQCVTGYQFTTGEDVVVLNCAIGVAVISKSTASAEQVLTFADYACYKARKAGANRVHVFQYDIAEQGDPVVAEIRETLG